jgi:F-type H+-transporting ATPase subunit epsilon
MGRATVVDAEGNRRYAACIGGMLSVQDGEVSLVPTTFEWAESIDEARAQHSLERAEKVLNNAEASAADIKLAEARLHRALVRKSVASFK